ncbi:MAG: DNA adenine methylase [Deltaproteobacteria bacterium]|nr:DNA adenine methylase [Deltaproteobacteria bacterium]
MPQKPIIPWIGGKRRLAKDILPLFPAHSCYVEPFCGAAALFFMKSPSKVEVINDINGDLVNLYRVVQHHLEELARQFKWLLVSRQQFDWYKQTPGEVHTDIQRAAKFLYLQKMAFGAKVANRSFGTAVTTPPRLNLTSLEEDLSVAHLRLARVTIEHLGWETCLDKYDRQDTLFFLDPPYWKTEGYGVDFTIENYYSLAGRLESMRGKGILTINNHPVMRKIFKTLKVEKVPIRYTVGGGKGVPAEELIVRNF